LAIYLASGGRRTLLVDGYLVTGRQGQQFGVTSAPGLSDATLAMRKAGGRGADEAATLPISFARQPTTIPAPTLLVMPGGAPPPNPDKVLASQSMDRTLTALRQSGADMVVFDSPPLLGRVGLTAGAKAFLKHADGVLVVVDLGQTRKDHLLRAQTLLAEAEAHVLGCVVVDPSAPTRSGPSMQHAPPVDATGTAPVAAPVDTVDARQTRWAPEPAPTSRNAPSTQRASSSPTSTAPNGGVVRDEAPNAGAPTTASQETKLHAGRPRARRKDR
jgi:Mrp family chromosome partitioning ATPase